MTVVSRNARQLGDHQPAQQPKLEDKTVRAAKAVEWMTGLGLGLTVVDGRLSISGDHPQFTQPIRARVEALEPQIVANLLGVRHPHLEAKSPATETATERAERPGAENTRPEAQNAPTAFSARSSAPQQSGSTKKPPAWLADKRCAVCGSRHAPWGVNFNTRRPELTRWVCSQHRQQG